MARPSATSSRRAPARADLDRASLKEAAAKMDALLQHEGFTEQDLDEVTREFRSWRKKKKK